MATELKSINGVEIFSAGTWNGDEYTQADLDEMIRAFNDMKSTAQPPLKLGHNEQQHALFQDGLPAAGWVSSLYTKGSKLIADFVDIPAQIYELLLNKAYKKVSSEIFWNIEFDGKKYNRMLAAVALLGGSFPAVNNLKDILAMYGIQPENKSYPTIESGLMIKIHHTDVTEDDGDKGDTAMPKTEAEIKLEYDLQAEKKKAEDAANQLKAKEDEAAAQKADLDAKEKENAELKAFKASAEEKAKKDAIELENTKLESAISAMVNDKLISASMKPYVKAFLESEKKEYAVKNGEKEEKFSKPELLKQILKLHAAISGVNFSENSSEGDGSESDKDEKAQDAKIKEYAKKHDVSYGQAYRAVMKKS